jgi:hypothetical protein
MASQATQAKREKIERDVAAFLKAGGKVDQLDKNKPATAVKPRFNAGNVE